MDLSISFTKTVATSSKKMSTAESWEKAKKLFDQNEYLQAFYATLDYIDQDLISRFGNETKTEFTFPQGSAVINLKLQDNFIHISAPFVKIPQTKFLPIFRKCAELNFKEMTLPQIVLENDLLIFKYKMPIELCEPYKLYDVLRDISQNADKYDDEFVDKFGAERVTEPMTTPYDEDKLDEILANIKQIGQETLSHINYLEEKRFMSNACDALYVGLKRLDYYCEPSGIIFRNLSQAVDEMFVRENDWMGRLKKGKLFLSNLEKLTLNEVKEDIFIGFSVIPLKKNANRAYLKDWFESYLNETVALRNKGENLNAAYYGLYTLYTVLSNFNLEESSKNAIESGLNAAANKPWADAADIFIEVMAFFYNNSQEEFTKYKSVNNSVNSQNEKDDITNQIGNFMKNLGGLFGKRK